MWHGSLPVLPAQGKPDPGSLNTTNVPYCAACSYVLALPVCAAHALPVFAMPGTFLSSLNLEQHVKL